jgi:hypothetical protein
MLAEVLIVYPGDCGQVVVVEERFPAAEFHLNRSMEVFCHLLSSVPNSLHTADTNGMDWNLNGSKTPPFRFRIEGKSIKRI